MPALSNPKHERFAQALAKGYTFDAAYSEAGYRSDAKNAARLTKNDGVRTRLAELQERAAIKVEMTVADLVQMLAEDRDFATECGTAAARVSATMGIAKLLGKLVDKSEATHDVRMSDIDRPPRETREEWLARKAGEASGVVTTARPPS